MQVVEREGEEVEVREENGKNKEEGEERDVEKGEEVGFEFEEQAVAAESNTNDDHNQSDVHMSMMHRLNPTNPLRIVINSNTRAATPPPPRFSHGSNNIRVGATPSPSHFSHTPPHSQPRSTPTPQVSFFVFAFTELNIWGSLTFISL